MSLSFLFFFQPFLHFFKKGTLTPDGKDMSFIFVSNKAPSAVPVTCRCFVFICRLMNRCTEIEHRREKVLNLSSATYQLCELGNVSSLSHNSISFKNRNCTYLMVCYEEPMR